MSIRLNIPGSPETRMTILPDSSEISRHLIMSMTLFPAGISECNLLSANITSAESIASLTSGVICDNAPVPAPATIISRIPKNFPLAVNKNCANLHGHIDSLLTFPRNYLSNIIPHTAKSFSPHDFDCLIRRVAVIYSADDV